MRDRQAPRPRPAPGANPVLGHSLAFLREPLDSLERWGQADADVVRLRVAGRTIYLLTTPELVRTVLATESDSYRKAEVVRERLGTLQGGSLVLLEGEAWRERRNMLRSGMAGDRVAAMGSLTTRYTRDAVESWPTDRPIQADEAIRDLTLAILARALFGLDLRGERTPIHEAADDILARLDMQSVSTYLPEWVPTPTNRRFRRAVATLHDRLEETVAARDGDGDDLLSTMLAAGLPPETVRDELVAFLFAGYDSTATALSCTLGVLGGAPEVQTALGDELDRVLDGATPTPADLSSLPLLTAVVRESLRLYPPQYVLFREPKTPTTLGEYRATPGTIVLPAPWVLHRDSAHWDTPTAFRPGRWLDADGASVGNPAPDHAYIPYGGGPRRCLGAHLADQTLRLVVATVCQRRQLASTDSLSVSAGPTLSLDGGVELRATPREE